MSRIALLALVLFPCLGSTPRAQSDEELFAAERAALARSLRRGAVTEVLDELDEILLDDPEDVLLRSLRARALFARGRYEEALADAAAAVEGGLRADVVTLDQEGFATCVRTQAELLAALGRAGDALAALDSAGATLRPEEDPRDAWTLGLVRLAAGAREPAAVAFRAGAGADQVATWDALLAKSRCLRRLGRIEAAAEAAARADLEARRAGGVEPDVLAELGSLYFEAYGEVSNPVSRSYSPAKLYREALSVNPTHEGANLGLFQLYRFNWQRQRQRPEEFLATVFSANPDSLEGHLAEVSAALDDGQLKKARAGLERLEALAPGRREVRTERAALAWIEHDRERCEALLAELVAEDPGDSRPEREVGRHLLELYRFAEGLGFLERAVGRDGEDWEARKQYGRALANTGSEKRAREALELAKDQAHGRLDAWRDNMRLVLEKMLANHVEHTAGPHTFSWRPDAAPVLQVYLEPFYAEAREELAARYGFTPGDVRIEVFREWRDFSVRSTGYEGFPALGVCFGPVVTAVSPLSELRGSFSWARTSFHEFTHVVHLGLSHNRCPRWITEGLATWEEGTKSRSWWRNMRRDLVDARANDAVFPVRELNRAFRGPRVIFAYYQSGLFCQMLIEQHGFAPMVRLLEAFDRGLDLDGALQDVFGQTPEELDAAFATYVDGVLEGLAVEPRWSPESTFRRRFRLSRNAPTDPDDRRAWAADWTTVAWGSYWSGEPLDAREALRLAGEAGELPGRAMFLKAELALADGDRDAARDAYRAGIAAGAEDYRARMALGDLEHELDNDEQAFAHYHAAEADFPGYPEPAFAAELRLARLHRRAGDDGKAMEAVLRWLAFNAGDYDRRVEVATWLMGEERWEEAARLWSEANQVDPFRRGLHLAWGEALFHLRRFDEALREFDVGLIVPRDLEGDLPADVPPLDPATLARIDPVQRELLQGRLSEALEGQEDAVEKWRALEPELLGWKARALIGLGRAEDARAAAEEALASDPDCEPAKKALEELG